MINIKYKNMFFGEDYIFNYEIYNQLDVNIISLDKDYLAYGKKNVTNNLSSYF